MIDSRRPLSVLLLEDNDNDAELLTEYLRAEGLLAHMRHARTREAYEAELAAGGYEIILSDFSLPGYDGLAALESARKQAPDVPFIFVSGAIGEERAIDTLRRGATDYVLKDRLDRLVPAVCRALEEAEQRRLRIEAERERDRLLVSERQARELAEAANRMKDEFLAVVSHELRTPLSAILGWATLLSEQKPDAARLEKGLATIQRNARVQARLIEDILDISRVTTGKLHLRVANVALGACIQAAVDAIRPAANAKSIALTVDASSAGELLGDADRLQQVVWNLLSNAVKFTPPGGSVAVLAERAADAVELSVVDSGAGIEATFLPYVFERFRQADASKSRIHGGLGLGLAIVRHLVELHGGTVSAESDGAGRGSRFTVRIPANVAPKEEVMRSSDARAAGDVAPPESLRGLHILLVEDDPDTRELIGTILQSSGAKISLASSATEAFELLAIETPMVIVSDIGMPGDDGYSFVRRVRALPSEAGGRIPAIALTAYARDLDRREAEMAGYQRHLAKPVSPSLLVKTIAELARPN